MHLLAYVYCALQEKLDGYLQYMKGELERQAKFNPDRFDDLSKELPADSFCLVVVVERERVEGH